MFKKEFWNSEVFGTDEAQLNTVIDINNKKTSYIINDDDKSENNSVGRKISFVPNQLVAHDDEEDPKLTEEINKKFENYEELGEKYRALERDGKLLTVENIRKEYGKFTAVDNVCMNM